MKLLQYRLILHDLYMDFILTNLYHVKAIWLMLSNLKQTYALRSWSILFIFPPMNTRILQSFHFFLVVRRYGINKVKPELQKYNKLFLKCLYLKQKYLFSTWSQKIHLLYNSM